MTPILRAKLFDPLQLKLLISKTAQSQSSAAALIKGTPRLPPTKTFFPQLESWRRSASSSCSTVGTGHRQQRRANKTRGQFDLAKNRNAQRRRLPQQRIFLGHAGTWHDDNRRRRAKRVCSTPKRYSMGKPARVGHFLASSLSPRRSLTNTVAPRCARKRAHSRPVRPSPTTSIFCRATPRLTVTALIGALTCSSPRRRI